MGKMIQVRNVPDEVHRVLKARASTEGISLSDYIKRDLVRAASRPSLDHLDERVRARGETDVTVASTVAAIRELRDAS